MHLGSSALWYVPDTHVIISQSLSTSLLGDVSACKCVNFSVFLCVERLLGRIEVIIIIDPHYKSKQ